jgi:putative nucleotidyltransferase with HDIG domain
VKAAPVTVLKERVKEFWDKLKLLYKTIFPSNHHFAVFLLTLLILTLIATPELLISRPELQAGMVARTDIIAPFRFAVPKTPAEYRLEEERLMASEPDVFDFNQNLLDQTLSRADRLLADLTDPSLINLHKTSKARWLSRLYDIMPEISEAEVTALETLPINARARFLSILQEVAERGVAQELQITSQSSSRNVAFKIVGGTSTLLHPKEDILDLAEARRLLDQKIRETFPESPLLASAFTAIGTKALIPNLTPRPDLTREARDRARKVAKPEYAWVQENERIVEAHTIVTSEQERKLQALYEATKSGSAGWMWAGRGLLIFIILLSTGVFIRHYRREWYDTLSTWLVLAGLLLAYALAYRLTQFLFAGRSEITDFAFPAAFGVIIVTILFNIQLGVIFATLLSLMTPALTSSDLTLSIMIVVSGLAGAFAVRHTQRRSEIYFTVILIALANALTIIALGLVHTHPFSLVLQQILWGCISAVASVILASILLPLLERTFRILSPLHLIELSDLRHPLLRRLNAEAPGTYQHSITVGNLAEPIAETIGANGLLARVGAYFHDVGKLHHPEYFIENFSQASQKLESLSPSLATKIILGHVSEGIKLAKASNLPEPLVKFISEHHGTSPISFLYREALTMDQHKSLSLDDFRYPGPKPTSKETAIVMLADAGESAARSLSNPTAADLESMLENIIKSKLDDRQLEDSPLTLWDITTIQRTLLRGLLSIHHQRVAYPKAEKK